jgi:hypothetical protein
VYRYFMQLVEEITSFLLVFAIIILVKYNTSKLSPLS